jgi:HSP20 family molecular chaperone IbpA
MRRAPPHLRTRQVPQRPGPRRAVRRADGRETGVPAARDAQAKGAEAKAVYKDGVLEVKIPKAAQFKPVPVKVQTAA